MAAQGWYGVMPIFLPLPISMHMPTATPPTSVALRQPQSSTVPALNPKERNDAH